MRLHGRRGAIERSRNDADLDAAVVDHRQRLHGDVLEVRRRLLMLFGSATQLWMPKSRRGFASSSGCVRSEWTMPLPAVIQFSSPGVIG